MKLKKLRILHIITQLELGGAQKHVLDIIRSLDRTRFTVYLVSSDKGLLVKDALNIPETKTILLSSLTRPINPLIDLIALFKLILLFKKERIDLVHTHSSKAGILGRWAARLAGVPLLVHTIHGWGFHNYLNSLTKSIYSCLERVTAKFTDKLVAVSKSDIQKGLRSFVGNKDKYVLIPYGIDQRRFVDCDIALDKKKSQLGLDACSQIVAMVACLKPQKSPQDFVQAASLVIKTNPKVQFLLVGDGVLRPKVKELIKSLKLSRNFFLTGWRENISEILSCVDILVLSSLWEGSPLVFLEAMSKRLPIVAYDVDGVGELVKDGINGFLVAPKDIAGMAKRINELLEDKQLLKKMGSSGFELAANNGYQRKRMLQDLDQLYCSLAEKLA